MKTNAYLLCLLSLTASAAIADTYPKKTLVGGSMACYKLGDWRDLVAASLDQDEDGAAHLVASGKCRTFSTATRVGFIETDASGASALIQLPSGKTAMTAMGWLK
ncbi:hypothetical protein IFT80_19595 [Pseudomonas sp. CFBP 8771]|uniref:hypothetical protein n=1 Tax=Pseudomonas sp. CFBP 8771 TaxID=2775285 RepID=UPI00178670EB|nr:hypothetical protein [Pseudomonas sp. CFBP 8771]MBD8604848.1 hypothetical protein [Pseudomonas sp. CFBP 8771]